MDDLTEGVKALVNSVPFKAAVLAGVLAMLRFFYDNDRRKWHRKVFEIGICIVVTYGVARGIKAIPFIHLEEDAAWLIATGMGWWGADYVRERAKFWFQRKVDGEV